MTAAHAVLGPNRYGGPGLIHLAMITYLIAGPDGTKAGPPQRAPAPAQEATR
jgi:hypothetical protein